MIKSVFSETFIFALVLTALFVSAHPAPPAYSIEGGVGSGRQLKGRTSNPVKTTNFGAHKQIKKLERFVDMHKDINNSNLDPITKGKRIRKLDEVQKRLDYLNERASTKKSIQQSKPGLQPTTYSHYTTLAMKQGQTSGTSSKPSSASQSPQRSQSSNRIVKAKKESPDSIMSRHFGGWQAPQSHQVSAH